MNDILLENLPSSSKENDGRNEPVLKSNRYKDLDALRGIAALMIVLYHFATVRPNPIHAFYWADTGVDMFFIISGFVIFMSINKVRNVKDFAISRFSRLFPSYWFCLTITAIIQVIALKLNFVHNTSTQISWLKYISNLTMFQRYFGYTNIDGPYWTLIIEMLFYVGIAILFKFNRIKNIFCIGCLLVSISFINDYLGITVPDWPFSKILLWIPIIKYISLFFAGILFYKLIKQEGNKLKLYLTILACYLVQIKIYSNVPITGHDRYIIHSIVLALIFVVFILFINQKLSFITNNVTLFFGKISYSLYLIHQYIGANILLAGFERILHLPILASIPIAFIIVIFIAYLINKFIEVPGGKYLNATLNNHFFNKEIQLN